MVQRHCNASRSNRCGRKSPELLFLLLLRLLEGGFRFSGLGSGFFFALVLVRFGRLFGAFGGPLGRVALSYSTLYYTFQQPRPTMHSDLNLDLDRASKKPITGDMITHPAKTSSQTEPPQNLPSLTSHIDLSSPGSPERTSVRYMRGGMGPVCLFCDSLSKGKRGKVGPLRGRAERAFRKQNTSRGILFVRQA